MKDADADVGEDEVCFYGNDHSGISPHRCPYNVVVYDDYEFECVCCYECEEECALSI